MTTKSEYRALIIGNNQYNDPTLPCLITPTNDATELAYVLKNPEIGNFVVEILPDIENAQFRREVERFFAQGKINETLLFYFSGHGLIDNYTGDLYLGVKDTQKQLLDATGISSRFIRRCVEKSKADSKIVILDCCYGSAITSNLLAKGPSEDLIGKQFAGKGVVFLSASTAWQLAFQGTSGEELGKESAQSIFTRFLVQGLATGEADLDTDGQITVDELYTYVFEQVWQVKPDQTPVINKFDTHGNIVIARSVKPKSVTIPQVIRELLNSSQETEKIAGVRALGQLALDASRNTVQLAIDELEKIYDKESSQNVKNLAGKALAEAGVSSIKTGEKCRVIHTVQLGHEFLQNEQWTEAKTCFKAILQQDRRSSQARSGLDRATHGENTAFYFQQAIICLDEDKLDEAYELLLDVGKREQQYNFKIKGATELRQRIDVLRKRKLKDVELREAKSRKDWPKVIQFLEEMVQLNQEDKQAKQDLDKARQELELQTLYQSMLKNITEERWLAAENKVATIENEKRRPYYEDLAIHKRVIENNKRWAGWYSDLNEHLQSKRWDEAIEVAKRINDETSGYKNVAQLLRKAERGKNRLPILKRFYNPIKLLIVKQVGRYRLSDLSSSRKKPSSERKKPKELSVASRSERNLRIEILIGLISLVLAALAIPSISNLLFPPQNSVSEFKFYVNGSPINGVIGGQPVKQDYPSPVMGGERIELTLLVIDGTEKTYAANDLTCRWSVAPISDENENIKTEACKSVPYIPSRSQSQQRVTVLVEDIGQHLKPVPPISIDFEIQN